MQMVEWEGGESINNDDCQSGEVPRIGMHSLTSLVAIATYT